MTTRMTTPVVLSGLLALALPGHPAAGADQPAGAPQPPGHTEAGAQSAALWLHVNVGGSSTWLNLERIESIQRPAERGPGAVLPILIIQYGSGRQTQLVFDDDKDLREALSAINRGLRVAGR